MRLAVTALTALLGMLLGGCDALDPVSTEQQCDGPAPISENCDKCKSVPYAAACPQCQVSGAGRSQCENGDDPGTPDPSVTPGPDAGPPRGGRGGSSEVIAGAGGAEAGSGATMNGIAGTAGNGAPPPAGAAGMAAPSGCDDDSGCAAPRPGCKDRSCVECTEDMHCPNRACDKARNVCVACTNNSHCPNGACKDQLCVACIDNGQCRDTVLGTCNAMNQCVDCDELTQEGCPSSMLPACVGQECLECINNMHCRNGTKAERVVCAVEEHRCVECLTPDNCNTERPVCDIAGGRNVCVQCLADTDCPNPAAARCTANQCAACTENSQCAHLAETPFCEATSGECVTCLKDDDCRDGTCVLSTHTCSQVRPRSRERCTSCETSTQCATSDACVALNQPGDAAASRCVPRATSTQTTACPQGYRRILSNAQSPDGPRINACVPGVTSCAAFVDAREMKPCPLGDRECGNGQVNEAISCYTLMNPAYCTILCSALADCESGFECASQRCLPSGGP